MTIRTEQQEEYDAWLKRLGKTIAEMRKELGLTQNKMAIKVGVDMKYYQDVEYGRRAVTTRTLHQFCKGFEVEIHELLTKVYNRGDK